MPEAKRPDPKRRSPASRPGGAGKPGEPKRDRSRGASASRREPKAPKALEAKPVAEDADASDDAEASEPAKPGKEIATRPFTVRAEHIAEVQSEQRFGSAARRAAILAAVVCVLTLTIAGPVRTYFAQRTEMQQLKATEAQLRSQIAELEVQKVKLADPAFIAAQARERLGFVMPGDIPYQVQLPPGPDAPGAPGTGPGGQLPSGQPWYTALWRTIADDPHGVSPPVPPPPEPPAPGG